MKKIMVLSLGILFLFASCANEKVLPISHKGKTEQVKIIPYGFFNMEQKNDQVLYRLSAAGIILGIILCETIIVPVIVAGWYLWEPISTISNNDDYIPGDSNNPENKRR
jgi:hypothetical protein